ncbi:NAD(P)H-binding protein [Marivirga sp. S37H4]|uniref:NAD(P)H-binding protein n=1 Tax=Marivirga aurantiaca TaxID=2802615 RepID=A0A934WYI8_9BACT|nr:NAD(P)H-binding protein [Marivirga aurantiaca]MBK6265266.1 NAD(P)H-binding protein [Marivirga aurantiaca]
MKILVLGASGATGKLLVDQLLELGRDVKVIVRASSSIPQSWGNNEQVEIIQSNIHEMTVGEMANHLKDGSAVASCLGHNLSLKGMYGEPKKLVKDAVRLVCEAYLKSTPLMPLKIVLMNTAGNSNRDLNEPVSSSQKMMLALIRTLLPPHRDNEEASDYLRLMIGQNHPSIQWAVVRPDTLIDEDKVSEYSLHASPTRSAIFNPGKTSRINVGHFMGSLIVEEKLWNKWKGQMPVLYNLNA